MASLNPPMVVERGHLLCETQKKDPAILKIVSGTLHNITSQFLTERRSRRLSKSTLYFYERYLADFCAWMDGMGVINLDELTAGVIRKYLNYLYLSPPPY